MSEEYKYIYPANARQQDQLDKMLRFERAGQDPSALENMAQEVILQTKYWYVTENRFPYEGAEKHFLTVAMEPVYRIEDMSAEMWADLHEVWVKLIHEQGLDGGALCFRFGNPAKSGASLTRLHCHFLEPKAGEKVKPGIGGRTALREGLHL